MLLMFSCFGCLDGTVFLNSTDGFNGSIRNTGSVLFG